MPDAMSTLAQQPESCKRAITAFDYLEMIDDESFQEDAIFAALNEGLIDYRQAYSLRTGADL